MKETKEKIVETAIYEFAKNGYKQTTTRDILIKAKANVAAISYYFGQKKGLYTEILTRIAMRLNSAFADLLQEYQKISTHSASASDCRELLTKCMRTFIKLFCSDKLTTALCMIYVREYVEPSPEFKPFFHDINEAYRKMFIDLLRRANNNRLTHQEAVMQVIMLFSFIFTLVTRKKIILEAMQWKDYSKTAVDEIVKVLCLQLFRKDA